MPSSKKPRGVHGKLTGVAEPDWEPLLRLARVYIDEFMWMFLVELEDGTRVQAYKHVWTRRYLYLASDDRSFGWCGDERYEEIAVQRVFDLVVGRPDPSLGIPRYTEEYVEGDGLDAR